jgi:hypothetical protein
MPISCEINGSLAVYSVAGRWSSPHAPATFRRCRLGPRGFPGTPPSRCRSVGMSAPMALLSSSERSRAWLEPLAARDKSLTLGSSSHGITRLRPSTGFRLCVHSQRAPKHSSSGRRYQPTTPVPSPWSLTTSTVSSAQRLQVCCALLPALRFAAFPGFRNRGGPKTSRPMGPFPATRFIPFKGFPSSAAVPCHHGRFPLTVVRQPPRRNRSACASRSRRLRCPPPPKRGPAGPD